MPSKHRGAWGEVTACAWLLGQGFEVFRNVSPVGLVDVVAMRHGEVLLLDIKSGVRSQLEPAQVAAGVLLLTVDGDGACKIERPTVCAQCGETFQVRIQGQRFCSSRCGGDSRKRVA